MSKKKYKKNNMPNIHQDSVILPVRRRGDNKKGHYCFILGEINECYVAIVITHDPKKGKGHNNIQLKYNPFGTSEKSYMKKHANIEPKSIYKLDNKNKRRRYGEISQKDYQDVMGIAQTAIERFKNRDK